MGKGEGRLAVAMTLYSGKHEAVPLLAFTAHAYGHPSRSLRPHLGKYRNANLVIFCKGVMIINLVTVSQGVMNIMHFIAHAGIRKASVEFP